jgi:hypothetical protein
MQFSNVTKLLLGIVAVLLLAVSAVGQRETGTISGTIKDAQGAVVTNATVTAKSINTDAIRQATTEASGEYTITNLQPGPYTVTFDAAGFAKTSVQTTVTVGSHITVDATLTIGKAVESVEVVAGAVAVDTSTQELSQVISSQQVNQLPSLTRNPYDFVSLSGNATEDQAGRGANGVALNGQRSASTNILLDGAENVDLYTATVGQQVPLDAVQEFRVTSSGFTADQGRASGGVVNVATKTGTNEFHGSAYEFNRLSALTSNTYDNNAKGIDKGGYTRNQFGYSVGGPIVKSKLFFFNSTEWTRVRSTQNQQAYVVAPEFLALSNQSTKDYFAAYGKLKPDATIAGPPLTLNDLGACSVDPNDKQLKCLGQLTSVLPTTTPTVDLVNYSYAADVGGGGPQNTWNTIGRVDYNINDKNQLFGRYAAYKAVYQPGWNSNNAYEGFDTGEQILNQNTVIGFTHIFNPTLISSSKIAYNRLNDQQPLGSVGVVPNLYYTLGGQLALGDSGITTMMPGYLPTSTGNAIPFGGPQNVMQFLEDISWNRGNHQFKFGGSYIYTQDNRVFGAYEEGNEFLSRTSQNGAFANLYNGLLYRFTGAIYPQGLFPCMRDASTNALQQTADCTLVGPVGPPSFSRSNLYNDANWYAQDNWKFNRRLTLNLGIRWEYYGVQHDKHSPNDANFVMGTGSNAYEQIANGYVANGSNLPGGQLWNSSKTNFAPRVGFAYDLFGDGKTSIRGGYGIAYERNFGNVTYNVIQNPPNYAVLNVTSGQDVPAGTLKLTADNYGPLSQPGQYPFSSPTLRAVDRNIKTAYAHLFNLSVEREVARNTVVALEYSGSRGINGYSISPYNDVGFGPTYLNGQGCGDAATPLDCNLNYTQYTSSQRLNLQYNAINYRSNGADSYHHALNMKFNASNFMNQGMDITANYTWSHTMDDLSATFGGSDQYNANTLGFLDPFNPGLDRGDADFDVRHRITFGMNWALPYAKNTHGWLKGFVDGWELAPIVNARTGYPYTIYDCTWAIGYNCPRLVPDGKVAHSGSTSTSADHTLGPNVFAYQALPPALTYSSPFANSSLPTCASDASGFSLGYNCSFPANMTGRNQFRQPGYWNFNLGIYKTFKLTERMKLQFRTEMYNVFNHSNYYVMTGNWNNASGLLADAFFTPGNLQISPKSTDDVWIPTANGTPEYLNNSGIPVGYTISGKKGTPKGYETDPSIIDRRFIQFALKLTF